MEINDLKSEWQNVAVAFKSEADLLKMTKIKNHPSIKSIRTKLIMETVFLVLFLTVYYDWFDGDKKPIAVNALLVIGLLLYIATDVIGYISISKKIHGTDLKVSLDRYLAKIRQLAFYSLISTILYSISFLVFFTSLIQFTKEKNFILLGFVIVMIQMVFWSQRNWMKWIKSLQQLVKEFNVEGEKVGK